MSAPAPPIARGMGYLPDRPDARDKGVGDLVAARGARYEPNQRAFRKTRLLQGNAGACFAFSLARAIHTNLLLQGTPEPPFPSPRFLYFNGRAYAYRDVPAPLRPRLLEDTGTRPRDGMQAARELGFAAWNDAPYSPADVRARPPRDAYFKAFDQKGLAFYRIGEERRVDAMADAMAAGGTVVLCTLVDTPFLWNQGDLITDVDLARVVGGHAVEVLDLTRGEVDIDNWWDDWGVPTERWEDGGTGRLSFDFVNKSRAVMDVYAVTAAPIYIEDPL